jgi:hypothetical protein
VLLDRVVCRACLEAEAAERRPSIADATTSLFTE